jgi:hypothetical protein
MPIRILGFLTVTVLLALIAGCGRETATPAEDSTNSNTSTTGLPRNAKPMGSVAPGYFTAGPEDRVSLRITSPTDDEIISGDSIAPTFEITGYPIYFDTERKKGQHLHVVLDNEPYEACYDAEKPFSPESGRFNNLKPGTHTLRVFPSREWHDSIKFPDGSAFDFVVFHVKHRTPGIKIDKGAPLLTYSRPTGEYRWKEDPRGLLLDFYVVNTRLGTDHKVRYSVNRKNPQILTRWEAVWWKWEELIPGNHTVVLEMLDASNKPVPFRVGNSDYNRVEHKFKILDVGEAPSGSPR